MIDGRVRRVDHGAAFGLALAVVAGLWLLSFAVARSSLWQRSPELLATAILVDLSLTAPLAYWFIGIRRSRLPAWSAVPVGGAGLLYAQWLLPPFGKVAAAIAFAVVALIEVAAVATAVVRIGRFTRALRDARSGGGPFFPALEEALRSVLPAVPALAAWARFELEVWCLALGGWFVGAQDDDSGSTFSHHRDVGWLGIVFVLVLVLCVEALVVHAWLSTLGVPALQVLATLVHFYGLLWLLGDAQALRIYRTVIDRSGPEPRLWVRMGLRAEFAVPLQAVRSVKIAESPPLAGAAEVVLLGTGNVHLSLIEAYPLKRLFRGSTNVTEVLVQVDEPERFRDTLIATAGCQSS